MNIAALCLPAGARARLTGMLAIPQFLRAMALADPADDEKKKHHPFERAGGTTRRRWPYRPYRYVCGGAWHHPGLIRDLWRFMNRVAVAICSTGISDRSAGSA